MSATVQDTTPSAIVSSRIPFFPKIAVLTVPFAVRHDDPHAAVYTWNGCTNRTIFPIYE